MSRWCFAMARTLLALFTVAVLSASPAYALTLSGEHLAAAEDLSCVLAEDALGRLDEQQFNRRFDAAVLGFDEASVDVIYAKALGYIDGLLFGLSEEARGEAAGRLERFSQGPQCASRLASRAVSL